MGALRLAFLEPRPDCSPRRPWTPGTFLPTLPSRVRSSSTRCMEPLSPPVRVHLAYVYVALAAAAALIHVSRGLGRSMQATYVLQETDSDSAVVSPQPCWCTGAVNLVSFFS